jgi:hypothetical protein
MELRKLTEKGIEAFRQYLHRLMQGSTDEPPFRLLTEPEFSQPLQQSTVIEPRRFASRLDFACYLDQALEVLPQRPDLMVADVGLWSWLSLFYFDQTCPINEKGGRKPGRDYRHIPEPGYPNGHRHLLLGAYLVYTLYGWGDELSRLLLSTALAVESHFHHEIAARHSFITNRGIMEALHLLYYDDVQNKPRRGPVMKRKAPGSLYRFIDLVQQLDLTYDLYSMSGSAILGLLPAEFNHWMAGPLQLQARL